MCGAFSAIPEPVEVRGGVQERAAAGRLPAAGQAAHHLHAPGRHGQPRPHAAPLTLPHPPRPRECPLRPPMPLLLSNLLISHFTWPTPHTSKH